MEDYIPLSRLSLNLQKDGASPTRNPNELQVLKNYRCNPGGIYTRKGITVLTHTPSTTPADFPETGWYPVGAETAQCLIVFKFENSSDLCFNSVQSNLVTDIWSTMVTLNYSGKSTNTILRSKQGTHSFDFNNITTENTNCGNPARIYGMYMNNAKKPSWFIGDTAENTKSWMVTMWIYPYRDNDNEELYSNQIVNVIVKNQWHFVATWCDFVNGNRGLYHYDDVTKTETVTANTFAGPNRGFYVASAHMSLGGKRTFNALAGGYYCDVSESYHGQMDYMTHWTNLFTDNTSNITLVRAIRDLHKA
jgi:hypothetical protein